MLLNIKFIFYKIFGCLVRYIMCLAIVTKPCAHLRTSAATYSMSCNWSSCTITFGVISLTQQSSHNRWIRPIVNCNPARLNGTLRPDIFNFNIFIVTMWSKSKFDFYKKENEERLSYLFGEGVASNVLLLSEFIET